MYYEKDTPPMNNQGEGEKGGAFLLALMGEPPDSGFLVGMRAGSVEQVPVAQWGAVPGTMVLEDTSLLGLWACGCLGVSLGDVIVDLHMCDV